jgi:protein gp37
MSDVFEAHPAWETERPKLWELIDATSNLDWLLLTKRPENILGMVPPEWLGGFPPNVWVGTTVENQEWAEKRIPHLLRVPARVRFLSCEPLLGPVDLRPEWLPCPECRGRGWYLARFADNFPTACDACMSAARAAGAFVGPGAYARPGNRVNWVIAGGESGHGVRPSHPDWFRRLRDDCQAAGVPFHFKQWGCWQPRDCMTNAPDDPVAWSDGDIPLLPDGTDCRGYEALADAKLGCRVMRNVGKKNAGRVLDGRTWDEMPAAENLNA